MIETGAMNDNEIVVRRGLTDDDRVLLTPPADKLGHQDGDHRRPQAGAPVPSGDTATGVTLPVQSRCEARPSDAGGRAGRRKPLLRCTVAKPKG